MRRVVGEILAIVTVIVVGILAIAGILSHQFNLSITLSINLLGGIGSIVLSGILAYLYLRMWSTQKDRTITQEKQEEILEEQKELQKELHDMRKTEKRMLIDLCSIESNVDDVYITLSNYGGGAIINLNIRTKVLNSGSVLNSGLHTVGLVKTDGGRSTGGSIVGPQEKEIKLTATPVFHININGDEYFTISDLSTYLSNEGVSSVRLQIELICQDEYDNISENTLMDSEVTLHNNMDFDDLEFTQDI